MSIDTAKLQLIEELKQYQPIDATDTLEHIRFINFLENNNNVYSRDNLTGHLTASSRIVNKERTKVLLIHHNLYNCRAPLGGHADDETDLGAVAIKEAQEESGVQNVIALQQNIIDIAILPVLQDEKRGKTVPYHFHFDVRYLLEADETETLARSEREVSDIRWFPIHEIEQLNIDIMPVVQRVMRKVYT